MRLTGHNFTPEGFVLHSKVVFSLNKDKLELETEKNVYMAIKLVPAFLMVNHQKILGGQEGWKKKILVR